MQRYYSRIYWHFTGSPAGGFSGILSPDQLLRKSKPKSEEKSVELVEAILESQVLKATGSDQIGQHETHPFCCTTDIPFKDLVHHSEYYGRAAIGFKAHVIHDRFLPVFYLSSDHAEKGTILKNRHPIIDFIKLTDFDPDHGHTFYREREWRHIGDFRFEKEDIAAIVIPDSYVRHVHTRLIDHQYPGDISVLSWRLIEEA